MAREQLPSDEFSITEAYRLLGATPEMSDEELKRAFRLARVKYHPDAGGSEDAFKDFTKIYEELLARRGVTTPVAETGEEQAALDKMNAELVRKIYVDGEPSDYHPGWEGGWSAYVRHKWEEEKRR